jgi:hypothetical protein
MASDLEKVSYIDSNIWKIVQGSDLYHHIITFLHTTWGTSNKNFFPGAQPVSIERQHFPILRKNDYVVCEKTDGIRHACVCTTFSDKKICALVDRSQNVYLLPIRVPTSMFQGSIFDGELVKDHESKWNLMLYDCLIIDNIHVSHLNIWSRIHNCERFANGITRLAKDPVTVRSKRYWNCRDGFEEFLETKFPYETDGIILTPVSDPVRSGTHETMFKWKPRDTNTIDFLFRRRDGVVWNMYVQEKGQLIFESELYQKELLPGTVDGSIVECQYIHWELPRWWKPKMIRTDKKHPNNRRTFYRTLKNIAEDIQLIEFSRLFVK